MVKAEDTQYPYQRTGRWRARAPLRAGDSGAQASGVKDERPWVGQGLQRAGPQGLVEGWRRDDDSDSCRVDLYRGGTPSHPGRWPPKRAKRVLPKVHRRHQLEKHACTPGPRSGHVGNGCFFTNPPPKLSAPVSWVVCRLLFVA
jgi:hypothetical protein